MPRELYAAGENCGKVWGNPTRKARKSPGSAESSAKRGENGGKAWGNPTRKARKSLGSAESSAKRGEKRRKGVGKSHAEGEKVPRKCE